MEKITMLGVSNSGKTCFIYAMYDFILKFCPNIQNSLK